MLLRKKLVKAQKDNMKPSDFLTELSNEKLAQYKTAASADATKADKEKDFARGNKRFSGIVKATNKQFDNDAKKPKNESYTVEDEQIDGMAQGEIREIIKNAIHIKNQLDKGVSLDGWMYSFVTVSNDKLNSVAEQINNPNIEEQGVAEGESNDTAISLSKLGKFHPGTDTLAEFVPERATAQYALHPDKWESTFYSLTNKDSDKLKYYGPKKISIPPGTLVGDMAIANKFYRAKTPEEQEQYAELYKASLQPYPVDVSQYRMPELLIPKQGVAEGLSEMDNRTPSGDRREQRANSPEEKAKQNKEQQKRLKDTSPEMRKKLRLPEPKEGVAEEQHSCPHCGGEMVSEELMNEKKDACYYKVKSRYSVWPSAYASGALVKCRKSHGNWGNGSKNESSILEGIERADESLHDWFTKEKWVRMDTKGNIKGPCAREPGEGKPKCLPQSKAQNLGKKGRASAAARKRREDPNPDRHGKAINVNTKKETKG